MNNAPSHQSWTLLLDFSNAFNHISCQAMFQEIHSQLPSHGRRKMVWVGGAHGEDCITPLRKARETILRLFCDYFAQSVTGILKLLARIVASGRGKVCV